MADSDDESYTVPLRDQRYFGAGLKRKRVQFVASTDSLASATGRAQAGLPGPSASEKYLSVVLNRGRSEPAGSSTSQTIATVDSGDIDICPVCKLPVSQTSASQRHENSLAHQVCLPHIHPPSSLDRRRTGLGILQAYGWDPDQRVGLGASGKGILHPVKANDKKDKYGLGIETGDSNLDGRKTKSRVTKQTQKLDAGKVRRMDAESRKRDQRMREMFYRDDEVEKYLGGG